jgi:ABC-type multidrug transport system fused ATPase/permease subunit
MRTEAGIIDAMQRLVQGRTTFTIAHRLSTLDSTDLLFEVGDGRIRQVRRDVDPHVALGFR